MAITLEVDRCTCRSDQLTIRQDTLDQNFYILFEFLEIYFLPFSGKKNPDDANFNLKLFSIKTACDVMGYKAACQKDARIGGKQFNRISP
jgi:hypothetical protein